MANSRNIDDDFVGSFTSVAELERRYPAAQRSGLQATVSTAGTDVPYICNGVSWAPIATYATDPLTGAVTGLAVPDGQVRSPLSVPRRGNVGTRIFGGRMGDFTLNASGNTFEVLMALAQDFDAVRIITSNSNNGTNTSAPLILANVATVGDTTVATTDAADWSTQVTWGGSGTQALTVSSGTSRRTYQVSDWILKSSTPRTDGGTLPLLVVRGFVATNANPITIMGNGTDSFTNWATHPSGRIWKMRVANGNFASTSQSTFNASASVVQQAPIIGVQYAARGRVITVMAAGDSITEGRGTYIGEGFVFPACVELSNKSGVAVEYCNIGWSGVNTGFIARQVLDVTNASIFPDLMFLPSGSPNDIGTTITAALIASQRSNIGWAQALCRQNQIIPVIWPWLPSNTAVKAYGATDSLRVAYNQEVYTFSSRGIDVPLVDTPINGVNSGGQIQMTAGTTDDNIHPNDAGNAQMKAYAKPSIARYVAGW